jgi:hypothetical protein
MNCFRKISLIGLAVLVMVTGALGAAQIPPTYPTDFRLIGSLSKGSTQLTDLSGYKVVVYQATNASDPVYASGYASALTDAGGNFNINLHDDARLLELSAAAAKYYYIGVVAKTVNGASYGVNETSWQLASVDLWKSYKIMATPYPLALNAGIIDPTPVLLPEDTGLYISRGGETPGSACTITWNADKFGGSPQIYVMTGSGTGEFTNSYNSAAWTRVWDGTKFLPNLPGNVGQFNTAGLSNGISSSMQVGAGSREVYYKALPAASTFPPDAAVFQNAPAVGKILVTAAGKGNYNMVGVPLIQQTAGGTFVDTLSQAINRAGVEIYKFDNTAGGYVPASYAADWGGANFSLIQGEAAWIYNPLDNDLVLTIVGGVPLTTANRTNYSVPILGGQYNMISNIYPQGGKLSALGLQPLNNAEIYYFDNVSHGYVSALANGSAWDNDLVIKPGDALWYYNPNSSLQWKSITR